MTDHMQGIPPKPSLCSTCKSPALPGQRQCAACHAAYMRNWRKKVKDQRKTEKVKLTMAERILAFERERKESRRALREARRRNRTAA